MERYEIRSAEGGTNGLALIINIKDFNGEPSMTRYGSERDVENLQEMLTHLNFKVDFEENLNKTNFLKKILDFVDELENNAVDVCFVCIMSHGADDGKIVTADSKMINVEADILDRFKNKHCKTMIGKPKVFLFLACRGEESDAGVMLTPTGSRSAVTDSSSASKMVTEQLNDSFVAFSTTPHHVSYRSTAGSPFITITCQVLRDEADKMHLQDMFTKIKMQMDAKDIYIDEEEVDGSTITCKRKVIMETNSRLGKHLYLLPERTVEVASAIEDRSEPDGGRHKKQKRRRKSECLLL